MRSLQRKYMSDELWAIFDSVCISCLLYMHVHILTYMDHKQSCATHLINTKSNVFATRFFAPVIFNIAAWSQ